MAPDRVKGVMMQIWPAAAKSINPWHIGMSRISGELVLITV